MYGMLRNKQAKDGNIQRQDIIEFLNDYGEMLLDCPGDKVKNNLFKNFEFDMRLVGAL